MPRGPDAHLVIRRFDGARLHDVGAAVHQALGAAAWRPAAGARVAIAVGSRGIDALAPVVAATVSWLRAAGARPFIVPAMGSHGGATAAGQAEVLAHYGVTEATAGAPVVSSMSVRELPRGEAPMPVFCAADALDADDTIVINRVKPHTDFHGPTESGLVKMIAIGLGKHAQALAAHALGVPGIRDGVPLVARQVLAHGNVRLGLALEENAYGRLAQVTALAGPEILAREPALLERVRRHQPGLPCDALDVLVVDELGKDISGTGMDTNVIGRRAIDGEPEPPTPRIGRIVARRLSAASGGNGAGVGLADVVCQALADAIDWDKTDQNVRTSGFPRRGVLPPVVPDEEAALAAALDGAAWSEVRLARIGSTRRLDRLLVSPALAAALSGRTDVTVEPTPVPLFADGPLAG